MSTIMFYTSKAGITANGVRQLKKAGVTAIRCENPKEIKWPGPSDIDFSHVQSELSLIMLRTLTQRASSDFHAEAVLGRNVLAAMNAAANKAKASEPVAEPSKKVART